MRTLLATLAIATAQAKEPARQWPPVEAKHVVGYCYDYTKDPRGSSISFPDGSLHQGVIRATTVRLTGDQTKILMEMLNKDVEQVRREVDCYDPHHAFVFYDGDWKVLASIDICFMCSDYAARPVGASERINLRALSAFCRDLGLPLLKTSEAYSQLYQQEQPRPSPGKKPQTAHDFDPFAPVK